MNITVSIEDYDHCQVGSTGGESLVSAFCCKYEQVGYKVNKKRLKQIKNCQNQNDCFNFMSIRVDQS
jgi:hypothetical protein